MHGFAIFESLRNRVITFRYRRGAIHRALIYSCTKKGAMNRAPTDYRSVVTRRHSNSGKRSKKPHIRRMCIQVNKVLSRK
jgi:hypothetical protein